MKLKVEVMEVGMKHEDGGSCTCTFLIRPKAQRAMGTKSVSKLIEIGMELNSALRLDTLSAAAETVDVQYK